MQYLSSIIPFRKITHAYIEQSPAIKFSRMAIDQSGSLGTLYNAYEDQMLGTLGIKYKTAAFVLDNPIKCILFRDLDNGNINLLQMVDINISLRLSILLKMVPPAGIASIINYPRIINQYTRFLYICQKSHQESCRKYSANALKSHDLSNVGTSPTHLITGITYGLHAMIIIQLSPDHQIGLDRLLDEICTSLKTNDLEVDFTEEKVYLINKIVSTTCYSNIHDLNNLTKLDDIYKRIVKLKINFNEHRPLKYAFFPLQSFSSQSYRYFEDHSSMDQKQMVSLENYLREGIKQVKTLQLWLDHCLPELLNQNLQDQLNYVRSEFSKLCKLHENHIQHIRTLLIEIRKGEPSSILFNTTRELEMPTEIMIVIQSIVSLIEQLDRKGKFIKQVLQDCIEYQNVAKLGIQYGCSEQLMKDILFKDDSSKVFFCSHDNLKEQNDEGWTNAYTRLKNIKKANPRLKLIYADFTYSTYNLKRFIILNFEPKRVNTYAPRLNSGSEQKVEKISKPISVSDDRYINIVLIGETGVGKSTFINALANYLTFNTLKEAQFGKPTVVIPVSFLLKMNDNSEEEIVKFGAVDSNEDHNNSGQSVTQQCRSYVFTLPGKVMLRIIDTPGFGDTRGITQDELNMNVIFSFMNNLTHLNSICLLFKSNLQKLDPFWSSCLNQLFDHFGENIRDHICFCFTNSRSTLFAPGDTQPLLKSLLDSLQVENIPFEKKNSFCLDSECFRYLAALQQHITFNDDDTKELEKSWLSSAKESTRFQSFVCQELKPYRRTIEWKSIIEIQWEIDLMMRPMLEGLRCILRNILLHQNNSSIKLFAINHEEPIAICYTCNRSVEKLGPFYILPDHLQPLPLPYTCTNHEQIPAQYEIFYEFLENVTKDSINTLNEQCKLLIQGCAKFSHVLAKTTARTTDPFLSGLIRMIKKEQYAIQNGGCKIWNQQLLDKLHNVQNEYERYLNQLKSNPVNQTLSDVYKLAEKILQIPLMNDQMEAVQMYQEQILKSQEKMIKNENLLQPI